MLHKKCFVHSSRWFQKYCKDQYTQKAQKQKLKSRAWFKLQAIDQIDKLFYDGIRVIDLGASPGGWSYYAINKIGNTGNVIACDLLPMKNICGVDFFLEDCSSPDFLKKLCLWIKYQKVQIVLSDMSPNITGISVIDSSRSLYLGNAALNISKNVLGRTGVFLVKIFQGEDFDEYLYNVRSVFSTVKIRKPDSSRSNSKEVYIVGKGLKCR